MPKPVCAIYVLTKNITPNIKVWKTRAEIGIDNTIEYDLKSYQVQTNIVYYTKRYV